MTLPRCCARGGPIRSVSPRLWRKSVIWTTIAPAHCAGNFISLAQSATRSRRIREDYLAFWRNIINQALSQDEARSVLARA